MDGSCGWARLNRDDINKLVRRWDLDLGYAMDGRYFQESPFGIVKKFVRSEDALDNTDVRFQLGPSSLIVISIQQKCKMPKNSSLQHSTVRFRLDRPSLFKTIYRRPS